jgi:hypothetical protein
MYSAFAGMYVDEVTTNQEQLPGPQFILEGASVTPSTVMSRYYMAC